VNASGGGSRGRGTGQGRHANDPNKPPLMEGKKLRRAVNVWGKKEGKEEEKEGMTAISGKKFLLRLTKVTSAHENCGWTK